MSETQSLPFVITPGEDDSEVAALIESWRYRGPSIGWDAVVGHAPQVRRCREVVEALRRPEAELKRLRIRLGRGLILLGPAGCGKTLIARAMAGDEGGMGRDLIAPPVSELTPGLIARLYAQLARMADPVAVLLDEAEPVLCQGFGGGDDDLVRALCVAIDGLEPRNGPITLALTTASPHLLASTVTRAGRLAPRLELGLPSPEERRILFERAMEGLPATGRPIDVDLVIDRTAGWSGAEIAVAVEEAMSRSLLDHTDALTGENLMAIIADRYVIEDRAPDKVHSRLIAEHEAAHAIIGHLRLGEVAMVTLRGEAPSTRLTEERFEAIVTAGDYVDMAAMHLAAIAGDTISGGAASVSGGSANDRARATEWLVRAREAGLPYHPEVLERGTDSDRGSERMRAATHASLEDDAHQLLTEVTAQLAPHRAAIGRLAQVLLDAEDQTLSGATLTAALEAALT
jgi:ATPases of the AAA+ class